MDVLLWKIVVMDCCSILLAHSTKVKFVCFVTPFCCRVCGVVNYIIIPFLCKIG